MMYKVLDEDTIKKEILPHLSVAKRGFESKSDLSEVLNAILYKLKTGCQWRMLPVKSLFSGVVLCWQVVYHHFRKWCKDGSWQECWANLLKKNKPHIDLSSGDVDGSHTPAIRGGEAVAYQGRKKRKTCNSLYLTDRQGNPIAMSSTKAGNHHDLHEIEKSMKEIFMMMERADIPVDGLFINADAGFDSKEFRAVCSEYGVIANVCPNPRGGCGEDDYFLDDELHKERYSIERTNAWMDSFRSVLMRFDTTTSSWEGFNLIAFMVILLKRIKKSKEKV